MTFIRGEGERLELILKHRSWVLMRDKMFNNLHIYHTRKRCADRYEDYVPVEMNVCFGCGSRAPNNLLAIRDFGNL